MNLKTIAKAIVNIHYANRMKLNALNLTETVDSKYITIIQGYLSNNAQYNCSNLINNVKEHSNFFYSDDIPVFINIDKCDWDKSLDQLFTFSYRIGEWNPLLIYQFKEMSIFTECSDTNCIKVINIVNNEQGLYLTLASTKECSVVVDTSLSTIKVD